MNTYEINDVRKQSDFKSISFSKFQKIKVKKELIQCLISNKIESACYWTAELICAGHFFDLWEAIILFISRYIHLGNPKIPIYIAMRFEKFKEIVMNGYGDNELSLRNNIKIRQLYAEIICVLCSSRKKHTFEPIKIKKEDEFNMAFMSTRLKAPTIKYCASIFKKEDPKELYIATNELSYHISSESKNAVSCCYWLEWILEYEVLCNRRKDKCICERRSFAPVQEKYQTDIVWIVWDIILRECSNKNNELITKIINSLLLIFSIKYTGGVKKRRRFIIYFAISLLTEKIDLDVPMISNQKEIANVIKKINIIYKDIKKNEHSPNTDYLFIEHKEKSNLDKTIERLEKMNKILNGKQNNAIHTDTDNNELNANINVTPQEPVDYM